MSLMFPGNPVPDSRARSGASVRPGNKSQRTIDHYADDSSPDRQPANNSERRYILLSVPAESSTRTTALLELLGYASVARIDCADDFARAVECLRRRPTLPATDTHERRLHHRFGSLSPREAEVARLIGGGLSNRGIARELSISVGTAERHVSNIFSKLGFNRRSQVAAWYVRQELAEPRR
jgi:DNA-binding NarL/FixJ family response regulator